MPPKHVAAANRACSLGIFHFLGEQPPGLQNEEVREFVSVFDAFNDTLASQSAPWCPSAEDQAAFRLAVGALTTDTPASKAVPHIKWYGNYGCALVCSVPYPGFFTLALVSLDQWQFKMHSAREKSNHIGTARGDAAVLDLVGQVALDDFGRFMYVH
eukprot:6179700-Pleurochrysis_carterae.AAC.1